MLSTADSTLLHLLSTIDSKLLHLLSTADSIRTSSAISTAAWGHTNTAVCSCLTLIIQSQFLQHVLWRGRWCNFPYIMPYIFAFTINILLWVSSFHWYQNRYQSPLYDANCVMKNKPKLVTLWLKIFFLKSQESEIFTGFFGKKMLFLMHVQTFRSIISSEIFL